ncbi:hypothetical protein [Mesorhizobium amorphae]|uniref:hypothetical protein n=1 Tax=Mesorhizobium amorphae TaxID=71433 RepID=UPI0017822126|nr:hypothetical protein [Mesorhizobium amorphae]
MAKGGKDKKRNGPKSGFKVSIKVQILPGHEVSEEKRKRPNVARVDIDGQEYYVVCGRASVDPPKK